MSDKLKQDCENFKQLCEIFNAEIENFYGGKVCPKSYDKKLTM